MDSSPCHDSLSGYLSDPHGVKQSYVNKKPSCSSKYSPIEESEASELGTAVSKILNVQADSSHVAGLIQSSDLSETGVLGMENLSKEFKIETKLSSGSTQKVLNKSISFPTSGNHSAASMDGMKLISTELHGTLAPVDPVYSRSRSLPAPSKIVSAMKGGREKEGIPAPLEKLNVKWAPDVRDPPTTTVSHTVKSYNQQQYSSSKSKSNNKKHGKRKQKGKSSRGNNSNTDKKQYRKYTNNSELPPVSSQTSDSLLLDDLSQSNPKLYDFGVPEKDSKCGSTYPDASLTSMHVSVTEAT